MLISLHWWKNNKKKWKSQSHLGPSHSKKKLKYQSYFNLKYQFDFTMGTVLVIFWFFWTDNYLVCAPPPPSGMFPFFRRHNFAHTFAHNSKPTSSIFVKLWEIVTNNMTITDLKKNTLMKYCYFWLSDSHNLELHWVMNWSHNRTQL